MPTDALVDSPIVFSLLLCTGSGILFLKQSIFDKRTAIAAFFFCLAIGLALQTSFHHSFYFIGKDEENWDVQAFICTDAACKILNLKRSMPGFGCALSFTAISSLFAFKFKKRSALALSLAALGLFAALLLTLPSTQSAIQETIENTTVFKPKAHFQYAFTQSIAAGLLLVAIATVLHRWPASCSAAPSFAALMCPLTAAAYFDQQGAFLLHAVDFCFIGGAFFATISALLTKPSMNNEPSIGARLSAACAACFSILSLGAGS